MRYSYTKIRKIRINDTFDLESVTPIQVPDLPGFYFYPNDNRIAVSLSGEIINVKTKRILSGSIGKNKSIYIHLHEENNKHTVYLKHRILARTFIGRPSRHLDKAFEELVVNHIDGDRLNNNISNLEWVTTKENIKHAHAAGLHPKDKPIIAYNVFTKKQLYFISAKECADAFNIHRATFHNHLNSGNSGKMHKNGYIFRYDDYGDFVIYPFHQMKEIGALGINSNIVVKNINEKTTTIFKNIKETAKYANIPHVTLWRNLTKKKIYKTSELEISFL